MVGRQQTQVKKLGMKTSADSPNGTKNALSKVKSGTVTKKKTGKVLVSKEVQTENGDVSLVTGGWWFNISFILSSFTQVFKVLLLLWIFPGSISFSVIFYSEEAPLEYWKELAESRRAALEEALNENYELHQRVEELEKEKTILEEMVEQAKSLASMLEVSLMI